MKAPEHSGHRARQHNSTWTRKPPGVSRLAVPAATLALTVALELFEAPVLSILATLRVVEALRDVSLERMDP
jgi:hypothetical protein